MVMKVRFDFHKSEVSKKEIKKLGKKALPELNRLMKKAISQSDNLNCLNQPFDLTSLTEIKNLAKEKKSLRPGIIVIVGIGGSNLGTLAVEKAVIDEYKYRKEGMPKIRYADTVDSDLMHSITKEVEIELAKGGNAIVIAISKSGTTLETLANFEILISSVKLYREDYKKYFVTISDSDSIMTNWAKENGISHLTMPVFVGGRYSVFSTASLFPLAMIGLKIDDILAGARDMHKHCVNPDIIKNPAIVSAAVNFYHYKKKVNISNTFVFGKKLENLGKWYRQLLAESLGKEYDLKKKKVNIGITPIISVGSEDLHSVEQLCIAGPYDKLTTFVHAKKQNYRISTPLVSNTALAKYMQGYELNNIMENIVDGVKEAFTSKKRPFYTVTLDEITEFSVGQFMMWKMFEVVYLGKILNLNPFDQPGVESYKKATREFMSKNAPLVE